MIIPRLLYQEEWRGRLKKEVDVWFHSCIMVLCGLNLTLNHLSLAFVFLFLGLTLGSSNRIESAWWDWAKPCRKCQKLVTYESGITCANFGATRGHFKPCEGAWCAECFVAHPLDNFEVKVPRDFHGVKLSELEDEVRYQQARPGDHLCLPFQCPNCQSQNIRGLDLEVGAIEDEAFECIVIRAALDAFWSQASKTVSGHAKEVRFMVRYGLALGFDPLPPLGPWPLHAHLGMREAMMVLMRSLEKGRNGRVVYSTARLARACLTLLWQASPISGADITLSSGSIRGQYVATLCPSEGHLYQRFETKINARMGDVVSQDRAYTLEILLALLEI